MKVHVDTVSSFSVEGRTVACEVRSGEGSRSHSALSPRGRTPPPPPPPSWGSEGTPPETGWARDSGGSQIRWTVPPYPPVGTKHPRLSYTLFLSQIGLGGKEGNGHWTGGGGSHWTVGGDENGRIWKGPSSGHGVRRRRSTHSDDTGRGSVEEVTSWSQVWGGRVGGRGPLRPPVQLPRRNTDVPTSWLHVKRQGVVETLEARSPTGRESPASSGS